MQVENYMENFQVTGQKRNEKNSLFMYKYFNINLMNKKYLININLPIYIYIYIAQTHNKLNLPNFNNQPYVTQQNLRQEDLIHIMLETRHALRLILQHGLHLDKLHIRSAVLLCMYIIIS